MPFKHYEFPKDPAHRREWIKLVNRQRNEGDSSMWQPKPDSKVCSFHFVDFQPTEANPHPTLSLGYQPFAVPKSKRLKNRNMTDDLFELQDKTAMPSHSLSGAENLSEPELFEPVLVPDSGSVEQLEPKPDEHAAEDWIETPSEAIPQPPAADGETANSSGEDLVSKSELTAARKRIKNLEAQLASKSMFIRKQRQELNAHKRPLHQRLLTSDSTCHFYTNIKKLSVFLLLCSYIKTHMTAQEKVRANLGRHSFFSKAKKHQLKSNTKTAKPKLAHNDIILLVLMKLRLGLLHTDIAERFGISLKDVSTTFRTYVTIMARALKPILIVFYPRSEIAKTLPKEYKNYRKLRCIIDCSEIFIQKPQDLQLQAAA